MNRRSVFAALLIGSLTLSAGPALATDNNPEAASALLRLVQDESDQTLFLRCCWARGRAGFHYCQEYGICESDRESVCRGIGPAEGRTLACSDEPPSLPEGG
ncbi:MAG: hypothetical protein WBN65_14405 [Gammaproteobacteria bacterium]